jgi:hypothetical protein
MPTSITQSITPFCKNYKGIKAIIIENLYPKIGIINEKINYV